MTANPYTLKEAAAVVGMSVQWLKPLLSSVPELAAMAFRTCGESGHWRLPRRPFDAWAAMYQAGTAFSKPKNRRRPPRRRRSAPEPDGYTVSLWKFYVGSRA